MRNCLYFLIPFVAVSISCSKDAPTASASGDGAAAAPSDQKAAPAAPRCANVAQNDLNAIISCVYPKGETSHSEDIWHLLAKESQADCGVPENWAKAVTMKSGSCVNNEVHVIGEPGTGPNALAKISLTRACTTEGRNCTVTSTQTWKLEDGKWRRLSLPQSADQMDKTYNSGDYNGALNQAKSIVEKDPYAISAHAIMAFALARKPTKDNGGPNIDDIIRTMLGINPEDSTALRSAATFNSDVNIAMTFLNKIRPDDCNISTAVGNVAMRVTSASKRMDLLMEKATMDDPYLNILKINTALSLDRQELIQEMLTPEKETAIRTFLDGKDSAFASTWAATMGRANLVLKNKEGAAKWLDFGILKDPNSPDIKKLAKKLR